MRRLVGFASGLVIVAALMWSGCQKGTTESPMTSENSAQQVTTLGKQDARVQAVMAVQNRHTDHLMKTAGVVGTATGLSDDGSVVMKVYTIHAGVQNIPASLENSERSKRRKKGMVTAVVEVVVVMVVVGVEA